MRGQVAAGDFANGPHAESTESAESLQPHFVGEEQIRRMSDHGNYTRARARAVKTFRTFRTSRSTVRLTKRRKLRPELALPEAQAPHGARHRRRKSRPADSPP